jgi:hypothetical protein
VPPDSDSVASIKRDLNEYLAVEWGHEGEVGEDNPFSLHHLGSLAVHGTSSEVFEFLEDGERFFALSGRTLSYLPAGQMSLEDLRVQELGRDWLGQREPIDLGTSRIGDERVPTAVERRETIHALIAQVGLDPSTTRILEGLFLLTDGRYVALVESCDGDRVAVVDGVAAPIAAVMAGLSAWRQLAYAVGARLPGS